MAIHIFELFFLDLFLGLLERDFSPQKAYKNGIKWMFFMFGKGYVIDKVHISTNEECIVGQDELNFRLCAVWPWSKLIHTGEKFLHVAYTYAIVPITNDVPSKLLTSTSNS